MEFVVQKIKLVWRDFVIHLQVKDQLIVRYLIIQVDVVNVNQHIILLMEVVVLKDNTLILSLNNVKL